MKSIPSKPWVTAGGVVAALMFAALLAMPATPALAAQQSGVEQEEAARARAELQAQLEQMQQRLAEQQQVSAEAARRYEQELQRVQEARERALAAAERQMQRVRVDALRLRSGCGTFGEAVLDHADDLSLSDEQVGEIRTAQRSLRRAAIERNADIEVGQMDLEVLYEADQLDLAAIRTKLEELATLGVDEQMSGLQLREQVRDILTPEQRQQLDDLHGGDLDVVISGVAVSRGTTLRLRRAGC
ncbi:MAG: Spy/CpxP family protein refolding chaperone [Acidobacteriota bacterium]|jgi:Spy/CpxP family protein refolding chaperone